MNTKRYTWVGLTLVAGVLATVLLVHLAAATPGGVQDTSFLGTTITGTVSNPAPPGTVVLPVPPGTWVWLLKPDSHCVLDPYCTWEDASVHGKAIVDPATGDFSLGPVAPGNYIIRAVPPVVSGLTPSFIRPVVVLNAPVNVGTLYLTDPTITGTVYLPNGITPSEAIVHVYAGLVEVEVRRTQVNGTFALGGLYTGTYVLAAEPLLDVWFWWSRGVTDSIALSETHYVSLTLRQPQVFGIVEDDQHARVTEATVHVVSLASAERRSDVTGPFGRFAVDALPNGDALVAVEPPLGRAGLIPPKPFTLTLPHTDPVTLTFLSSPKVVTGFVTTNVMTPVQNALVVANRIGAYGWESALTNADGQYLMRLAPGLWALTVKPINTTNPGHWVYPRPPQLIHFDDTPDPESKQLDFKVLTADATVVGTVEMPGGGAPTFTVTVGLHTDEGIGVKQDIDNAGRFTFSVPHGKYKVDVRVFSPSYSAPQVEPVFAAPLTTTVVPTITLIQRDAIITGTLTVSGTHAPATDVPVIAWGPGTVFHTRSGPDGVYALAVYSGTWFVHPAPLPDQPYLYTGKATEVVVASNQVKGNVDFSLLYADATIHGVLIAPDQNVADDAKGWGKAVSTSDPRVRNGAPVENGAFDILVPGGATYTVALQLADGGRYVYTGDPQVTTVGISETQLVTFPLTTKNAHFVGALRDRRNDMAVPNLPGRVWAWNSSGTWLDTDIHTGNGTYKLDVPADLWGLDYSIPEDSDWVKLVGARYYGLGPGQEVIVPLPVARKDGALTGTVLLPNGDPAVGATAVAEGFSPDIRGLTMRASVGADGKFSMTLPSGAYVVRAAGYVDESLVNPVEKHVFVPSGGTASVTLQYRQPDLRITGQVTLSGTTSLTGPVALFAWTVHGGYNKTIAPLGGVYTMPVISNTLWNLAAVYETRDQYWKARVRVPVTTTNATRDLVLDGPFDKPAPVSVLFDPTQDKDVELPDGTRIYIPAGAMPVESGNVLLHITPLAGAPHHHNGEVLGLTYAFEAYDENGQPITEHFNQNVVIVFKYDPALVAAMGLDEDYLRVAYYSTTTNSWTIPASFMVDEVHNQISMQIDHFTKFGILGTEAPIQVFLPIVMR